MECVRSLSYCHETLLSPCIPLEKERVINETRKARAIMSAEGSVFTCKCQWCVGSATDPHEWVPGHAKAAKSSLLLCDCSFQFWNNHCILPTNTRSMSGTTTNTIATWFSSNHNCTTPCRNEIGGLPWVLEFHYCCARLFVFELWNYAYNGCNWSMFDASAGIQWMQTSFLYAPSRRGQNLWRKGSEALFRAARNTNGLAMSHVCEK